MLGGLMLMQQQMDAGVEAFHKAMAAEPMQPVIPKSLGWSLMAAAEFQDAVSVWQDYVKTHPDDVDGPANLSNCFLKLGRYSEAAAASESSVTIRADRANLQASLGSADLLSGDRKKAAAAFSNVTDRDTAEE